MATVPSTTLFAPLCQCSGLIFSPIRSDPASSCAADVFAKYYLFVALHCCHPHFRSSIVSFCSCTLHDLEASSTSTNLTNISCIFVLSPLLAFLSRDHRESTSVRHMRTNVYNSGEGKPTSNRRCEVIQAHLGSPISPQLLRGPLWLGIARRNRQLVRDRVTR